MSLGRIFLSATVKLEDENEKTVKEYFKHIGENFHTSQDGSWHCTYERNLGKSLISGGKEKQSQNEIKIVEQFNLSSYVDFGEIDRIFEKPSFSYPSTVTINQIETILFSSPSRITVEGHKFGTPEEQNKAVVDDIEGYEISFYSNRGEWTLGGVTVQKDEFADELIDEYLAAHEVVKENFEVKSAL